MNAVRVIQISDTHLAPGVAPIDRNFDALVAAIEAAAPDLVVHTGDVTRDAPGAPEELDYAAERLARIPAPLEVLPGNHDIGDNPNDSDVAPKQPPTAALVAAFRDRFGGDRFALDLGGWRFVGLNAQLFQSGLPEEEEQWDWVEGALAAPGPVALFLHKPMFQDRPDEPDTVPIRFVPRAPRERLLGLMARGDVRAVGCGHVHQSRRITHAGALHVWAPAAAFVLPDSLQAPVGEKLCGALDWRFGADGSVRCALLPVPGLETRDILTLPPLYPGLG